MNKKIIITTIIIVGVLFTTLYLNNKNEKVLENVDNYIEKEKQNYNNLRLIRIDGKLYYDTGELSKIEARCGNMDGIITSHIDSEYIPIENNQSNFEGDYSYQYSIHGTIDVVIDGEWITFKPIN